MSVQLCALPQMKKAYCRYLTWFSFGNTILLPFRSAILRRQKLAQMNSGYFPRWSTTRHSFPDPLKFSRWRSNQISHPKDRCGCQNPNPRALYEVLFPWVARHPPPPVPWGKPMIGALYFKRRQTLSKHLIIFLVGSSESFKLISEFISFKMRANILHSLKKLNK